jgi:hypothetical protein
VLLFLQHFQAEERLQKKAPGAKMGDDYTGPVTVAADDGSERVLADINVWQQSETIMEMVKGAPPLAPL